MPKTDPPSDFGLTSFLAPVRAWFEERFGTPTPPQEQGWPPIQRGEHSLILAPTGSGKTLAAFLWGIDRLFREQMEGAAPADDAGGVRLLYISPLKALNNDIYRNLRVPLAGIRRKAEELGLDVPSIRVAVRSGDTPQRERRAMLRQPPHILITTPESFYLLLTSPKARDMFRQVRTVIVDEIHTLAGNKRGVHLALSLERLQHLADRPLQRIGLSATIRPLDEVARFLGGSEWLGDGEAHALQPRQVTLVDAAYEKPLNLQVVTVVDNFRDLPGDSIWPSIIPHILDLIREHRTTLVFANSRRLAERTADRLNAQIAAEAEGKASGLIEGGVVKGIGMLAASDGTQPAQPGSLPRIRVHHGSVSKEVRLELERQLKGGELPALVGTSSLELGIDIGAVDLIVQLQSPKSVAQGLQRVGRSGHLVGQTSKGRVFPTHREDVTEAAAIAGGMLRGDVEPTRTPRQPLDVLAQQIVAMISVETWDVDALYDTLRCAYPYHELTRRAYTTTLEMLAGRYPSQAYRELRARLAWDRVNHKLAALPGSRMLALTNGGTIPDRGSFGAYLSNGTTKLGELDEEFVFETHIGDTLMLGSQVWRVIDMTDDRVVVAEAPGATPRMPFWRGDVPWRPYELGQKVGAFRRAVAERLEQVRQALGLEYVGDIRARREAAPVQAILAWLSQDYALDARSAWHVVDYLAGQLDHAGAISSDRTILVEAFEDALGDPRLVIHSPFGGRVNGSWGLALASALRERTGVEVELNTNDDGILFRLLDADAQFPLDLVSEMGPAEARERILCELPDSAVFGTRFRQNAARALLLPGGRPGRRTPFWLQRLRARDLLQVVRQFDDFPIVAETYRDCLEDVLDLYHLERLLGSIKEGQIEVVVTESVTPSPVAQSLLWDFINVHMYEGDAPRAEQQLQALAVNRDLLQDLLKDVALDELLRPEAISAVRGALQHTAPGAQARTVEELAVLLQQMGDLSAGEIAQRSTVDPAEWLARLAGERRIVPLDVPTAQGAELRWVAAEYESEYRAAFGQAAGDELALPPEEARHSILLRYLGQAGPVTVEGIQARYAFPEPWLRAELKRLIEMRELVHGRLTPRTEQEPFLPRGDEFIERRALEQIHRRTMHLLRREVQPVPLTVYADFLAHWQHLGEGERLHGDGSLARVLQQLRAAPVVGRVWERDVLPLRLGQYQPVELERLCESGEVVWIGAPGDDPQHTDPRRARFRFLFRGEGHVYLAPPPEDRSALSGEAQAAYRFLQSEGAAFSADLCAALDLTEAAVERALIELVMAGLVTNDSLDTMRQIVQRAGTRPPEQRPLSALEEQLAQRRQRLGLGAPPLGHRPSPARYRAAKRRVRQRLQQEERLRPVGRWALVHRFGVLGKAVPAEERVTRQARQLLVRHGIVTHECLAGEIGSWEWGPIYRQLQRLEMRGEVRRGYFVRGMSGVQFALPEAVERLRALRDGEAEAAPLVMNACDPANLYGPARDDSPLTAAGEPLAFSRVPSTWLVQQRGLPVLVAGNGGAHLTVVQGAEEGLIRRALQALLDHLARSAYHVTVETWNGGPVLDGAGQSILESLGFYRDYPAMTWERRF